MNETTIILAHLILIPFLILGVFNYSLILTELRLLRYYRYSRKTGNELIMFVVLLINIGVFALIVHFVDPYLLESIGKTVYSESLLLLAFLTVYLLLSGKIQLSISRFLTREL